MQDYTKSHPSSHREHVGGKAARARAARSGIHVVTDIAMHRPCGGAPIASDLIIDDNSSSCRNHKENLHVSIMSEVVEIEKKERLKHYPHLISPREIPMDNHGSLMITDEKRKYNDDRELENDDSSLRCCLSDGSLREFTVSILPPSLALTCLATLDLSRNELWQLPSLKPLSNLKHLDLSRNWFAELPETLVDLQNLLSLNVSHNMLRSSETALLIVSSKGSDTPSVTLQSLTKLRILDLTFNQKCGHAKLQTKLQAVLPHVEVRLTINFPRPPGAFVGDSAADRDANLLRSQLEPWSTTSLRRRLVADFGQDPMEPETYTRAEVMEQILRLYKMEGERTVIRSDGILVEQSLLNQLLMAVQKWKVSWRHTNQERTSIQADNYMILTSPESWELAGLGRKKKLKQQQKLAEHQELWDLAVRVLASVDEPFAKSFSAIAVTHNFSGSPHIDRQNTGPFYGLSLVTLRVVLVG